jgi:hypothetical protein
MIIVRSHEPMMEGFESRESIITVFSCSDYGGGNNKASILHVLKNGEFLPKILPVGAGNTKDRWINLDDTTRKNVSNE